MVGNLASYVREFGFWLFVLWLALMIYLLGPPNTPPSAPAGVGIVHGFPVYAHPEVSYEDRYSPACLGPPIDDLTPVGGQYELPLGCPVSRAAVTAQGVGE